MEILGLKPALAVALKSLLRNRSTLDQLLILMRADALRLPAGRYYGGRLSPEEIAVLVQGLK